MSEESGVVQPTEAEAEAARMGWEPEEKWHGRPEDWQDAETYLRRGRQINGVLQKELKRERAATKAIQDELNAMKGTVAELAEYRQKLESTIYDRAMADLKGQLRAAREGGDFGVASDVEEAIDQLKETKPEVKKTTQAASAPGVVVEPAEVKTWKSQNLWYTDGEHGDMVSYVDGVTLNTIQSIQRSGRQPSVQEVLDVVNEKVRRMFPQEFSAPKGMVDGGGDGGGGSSSTGKSSSKGFSSLPSDVKAQFERFYNAGYYIDTATRKPLEKAKAQAEYFKDYSEQ